MKATVQSSELFKAVTPLVKIISPRPVTQILSAIKLEAADGHLTLTASNLDLSIIASVAATGTASGCATIDAKTFGSLIKTLKDESVTIKSTDDTVTVGWSNGSSTLPNLGTEDYPVINIDHEAPVEIDANDLAQALAIVSGSIAPSELRPVMSCAHLNFDDGILSVAGSDDMQLSVARIKVPKDIPAKQTLIHMSSLPSIRALLESAAGTKVRMCAGEKNVTFTSDNITLVTRLTEGKYPAYETVFPKEYTNEMTVDKGSFVSMLRRVGVCADTETSVVRFDIKNDGIVASAQDLAYNVSCRESVSCEELTGENLTIAMSATALAALLTRIPDDKIRLLFSGNSRAVTILPKSDIEVKAMLMPKRTSN